MFLKTKGATIKTHLPLHSSSSAHSLPKLGVIIHPTPAFEGKNNLFVSIFSENIFLENKRLKTHPLLPSSSAQFFAKVSASRFAFSPAPR